MNAADFTRRGFLATFSSAALGGCLTAPRLESRSGGAVGEPYAGWRAGELDIHFIQTGVGEQTFFIFPDGTTMLVDCGDMYREQYLQYVPRRPSQARLGGEWVSRYVRRLVPDRAIDYFLLTHWHADHCGNPTLRSQRAADGRRLCGITRFAEDFDIRNYFDHQYPRFGVYEHRLDRAAMEMVRDWLPYMERRCGMRCRIFEVGADDQIVPLRDPAACKGFSIRNLHANARYWDGHGKVIDYAPTYGRLYAGEVPAGHIAENALSLGFRIQYGPFAAYFGGDIDCPAYEEALAPVIGRVDVAKMNHHGCPSSMGRAHCAALRAKLWVGSTWSPNQITEKNLVNMASRELYPGRRFICPGHLPEAKRLEYAGRSFMDDFRPVQGHVVVKVAPGGAHAEFYVLTDEDESMRILDKEKLT